VKPVNFWLKGERERGGLRGFYQKNELDQAQQAAAGLFSDLPGFSMYDLEKIKGAVKLAWEKQPQQE